MNCKLPQLSLQLSRSRIVLVLALFAASPALAQRPQPQPHPDAAVEEDWSTLSSMPGDPCMPCDPCGVCNSDPCGCGPCMNDCCCGTTGFTAGFAFTFLKPHFEDNVAFVTQQTDDTTFLSLEDTTFDNDLELSPRVWLDYTNPCGIGARATYFQFDHNSPQRSGTQDDATFTLFTPEFFLPSRPNQAFSLMTAADGDTLFTASDLKIDMLDFEATRRMHWNGWMVTVGGGLRFGSVVQRYEAVVTDAAGTDTGALDAAHRFDGVGPTLSIEGRRPLGKLSFFGSARGALLYGNGKSSLTTVDFFTAGVPATITAFSSRNDVLPVAEFQVGLEWVEYCCTGGEFFVRTALESHVYQGVGNAASEQGDLGLFGFNAALGLAF